MLITATHRFTAFIWDPSRTAKVMLTTEQMHCSSRRLSTLLKGTLVLLKSTFISSELSGQLKSNFLRLIWVEHTKVGVWENKRF